MRGESPSTLENLPPNGWTPTPEDSALLGIVDSLVHAGGGAVAAVLLYGSHLQESAPSRWSAYDLVRLRKGTRQRQ